MPKVLHLIHSLNRGGLENWLISMLREVSRSQCEMDVCCKGLDVGSLASIAEQLGAKVHHCPLVFHVGFAQNFSKILTEGKYQILHNHVEAYSGFPVWVAHRMGIPVITSFHNTYFFNPQTWLTRLPILRELRSVYAVISMNYALRYSDLVTGCSQGALESLDREGIKIQGRSQVLYYGVNIPELSTTEARIAFRQSFGWSTNTPIILHVGRFIEQKNHLGILSVFEEVLERVPTAKLLLVGEGILQLLVENTIVQRGLCDSIRLLGVRDDVLSLMSKCDVFLLPSIHEGLGVVALEANAANLPVVGSKIPGLREAVREGETALLHDVKDIKGMAESVTKLISDLEYNKQIGNAGRTWVKDRYSTEISARELLKIYNSFTQ
jgi:glycosyltransferase involved in cell wall biosynthesis